VSALAGTASALGTAARAGANMGVTDTSGLNGRKRRRLIKGAEKPGKARRRTHPPVFLRGFYEKG
jgi:hypothetical protein